MQVHQMSLALIIIKETVEKIVKILSKKFLVDTELYIKLFLYNIKYWIK